MPRGLCFEKKAFESGISERVERRRGKERAYHTSDKGKEPEESTHTAKNQAIAAKLRRS